MTITGALNNAISGLTAARRNAEVTSTNIANAMTEGYSRREIDLVSRSSGATGGVRVNGIIRHADPALLAERRLSDARIGYRDTTASATASLENILGRPDEGSSISARLTSFEASLVTASSLPSSEARQQAVLDDAKSLVSAISEKSAAIQDVREGAEKQIEDAVETLNSSLDQLRRLNSRIITTTVRRADTAGLLDERQRVIDKIAEYVPVKVVDRDHNGVALLTTRGGVLFDVSAPEIGFDASAPITAHQRIENDTLATVTIGGREVDMSREDGPLSGGKLQALFDVRDKVAPQAQRRLDAFALDLVERFEASDLDSTTAAGAAGLFTDMGNPSDATEVRALSTRLQVNEAVDPDKGGELWRLRDGLGAATEGNVSTGTLFDGMRSALSASKTATDPALGSIQRSLSQHASFVETSEGERAERARVELAISAAEHNELETMEARNGVDTDSEMQNLLLIEQAYSANARVIQTAQTMIDALMRI